MALLSCRKIKRVQKQRAKSNYFLVECFMELLKCRIAEMPAAVIREKNYIGQLKASEYYDLLH